MVKIPDGQKRRLSAEFKRDINWWITFMDEFDGKSLIPTDWSRPDDVFATDASLKMCGGWAEPEFFKMKYPNWLTNMKGVSINELEMFAFLVVLTLWENRITNRCILAYCDNQCTLENINSGKASNALAQKFLREIAFILARNNAQLKVVFISSECNRIPDALSRWWEGEVQWERFEVLTKGKKTRELFQDPEKIVHFHNW